MKNRPDMVACASHSRAWLRAGSLARIESFLRSCLNPDGGFRGRSAKSDLYYTAFALDALAALSATLPGERVRNYLASFGDGDGLNFAHLASGVRCRGALSTVQDAGRSRAFLERLENYRSADGGYNHLSLRAPRGTVYGAYVAFAAWAAAGEPIPQPEKLLESIRSLRTANGGYANEPGAGQSVVTATSAAVMLQRLLADAADDTAVRALQSCECPAGGFLAFPGAPGPDLLSTASALYALRRAARPPASPEMHCDFISSLWSESGGFSGHPADSVVDCEYTFYALLALGACVST